MNNLTRYILRSLTRVNTEQKDVLEKAAKPINDNFYLIRSTYSEKTESCWVEVLIRRSQCLG